jgi:hypothetical protein
MVFPGIALFQRFFLTFSLLDIPYIDEWSSGRMFPWGNSGTQVTQRGYVRATQETDDEMGGLVTMGVQFRS